MSRRRRTKFDLNEYADHLGASASDFEEMQSRMFAELGDGASLSDIRDAYTYRFIKPEMVEGAAKKSEELRNVSKEQLVRRHNENGKQLRKRYANASANTMSFSLPAGYSGETFYKFDSSSLSIPLKECVPIFIRDLHVDLTHRGRVLRGRLIVESYFIGKRVYSVLEDDVGGAIMVGFGTDLRGCGGNPCTAARQVYPMNTVVAIWEPYFKRCNDGQFAVMVSNPERDVIVRSEQAMPALESYAAQARGFAAYGDYVSAIESFTSAIRLVMDPDLLLLFSGLFGSLVKLQRHREALAVGVCALACANDKASAKAYFMLAMALQALDETAPACFCAAKAKELGLKKGDCRKLADAGVRAEIAPGSAEGVLTAIGQFCRRVLPLHSHTPACRSAQAARANAEREVSVGDHSKAVSAFFDGLVLRKTMPELADLLFSRADCRRSVSPALEVVALSDAVAAVVLDATKEAHHHLLAEMLWNAGRSSQAIEAAQCGLENVEIGASLKKLRGQIRAAGTGIGLGPREAGSVVEGEPRFVAFYFKDPAFGLSWMEEQKFEVQYVKDSQSFCSGFSRDMQKLHKIAPTSSHVGDFFRGWGIPVGCHKQLCHTYLFLCEQTARKNWLVLEAAKLTGFKDPSSEELKQSLGLRDLPRGKADEIVKWHKSSESLSVRFFRDEIPVTKPVAAATVDYFFNPVPTQQVVMRPGVNLSVGAADLSELLWAETCRGSASAPIEWVGLFPSKVCFAKALVLAEMLETQSVEASEILQVWFSSIWTAPTVAKFRTAVATVLSDPFLFEHDKTVQATLQAWLVTNVSLLQARKSWLFTRSQTHGEMLPSFARLIDGMDLCTYEITGELPGVEKSHLPGAVCGSLTMFVRASGTDGSSTFHFDCHFLQCIPRRELMWAYLQVSDEQSIVSVGAALLERQIKQLQKAVAEKRLFFEAKYSDCSRASLDSVLSSYENVSVISWADVAADRLPVAAFHNLARSKPGVVHYALSCAWIREVNTPLCLEDGPTVSNQYAENIFMLMKMYGYPLPFSVEFLKNQGYTESPSMRDLLFVKFLAKPHAIISIVPRMAAADAWSKEFAREGCDLTIQHEAELYFPIYSCHDFSVLYMQFKYV